MSLQLSVLSSHYLVGNGYIGISLDGKHGVWLKGERGLDIATDYNPLVSFEISGYDVKGNCPFIIGIGTKFFSK